MMRTFRFALSGAVIALLVVLQLVRAQETRPGGVPGAPAGAPVRFENSLTTPGKNLESAVFAAGCFWCTEFAFEQIAGVVDVESGYSGGTRATANYDKVHLGTTGHAEAIRVFYDPSQVSYDELLNVFFDAHDPTQLNRQGEADVGRQYRSAIFYSSEEQKKQAEAKIADLNSRHVYQRRVVTKLEPLKEFYPAEDYHQNFVRRNPFLPYVQMHAVPKAIDVRRKHPEMIRSEE